jgi:CDP-diacylglycerol---glycerol-3-phosphate 3-phosphatidyltransferase
VRHAAGTAGLPSLLKHSAAPAARPLLTLPNLLTLSRLPLAALVWLRPADPVFVLGLMALAGLTDVLDGWLERKERTRRGETIDAGESIGTWLDPLCDKVFIVSLVIAVTVAHHLPLWLVPLLALREILQTLIVGARPWIPVLRRNLRPRFRANILGKLTTVVQFATIAAILLEKPGQMALVALTAALGLVAVAVYVRRSIAAD